MLRLMITEYPPFFIVLHIFASALLVHLVLEALSFDLSVDMFVVLYFIHEILVMPRSCLEHLRSFQFSCFLITLCSRLLILKSLQTVLHDFILLLGLAHVKMLVKHDDAVFVHASLATKRRQRHAQLTLLCKRCLRVQVLRPKYSRLIFKQ